MQTSRKPISRENASTPLLPSLRMMVPALRRHSVVCNRELFTSRSVRVPLARSQE